jgi:hypothetical protein
MGGNLGHRALVDQRALIDRPFETGAHPHDCNPRGKLLRKGIMDRLVDEEAVGADAGLPGVAELGGQRPFDRRIEIGILEDDERRVAAQFEAHPLDRPGALRGQQLAHRGRAGEGELGHARIGGQHFANGLGLSGHHAQQPVGQARFLARTASASAENGVSSEGLITIGQPTASAGPPCG